MRVTNGMIRNNTLNNLYKNISAVNQSFAQMSTGKKYKRCLMTLLLQVELLN